MPHGSLWRDASTGEVVVFTKRIVLRIDSGLLLVSGVALVPDFFALAAGISASAAGLSDFRAVYAGSQFALAGSLFWCEREPSLYTAGLVARLLPYGDIGIIRGTGLLVDGEFAAYPLLNLAVESLAVLAVGPVLLRARRRAAETARCSPRPGAGPGRERGGVRRRGTDGSIPAYAEAKGLPATSSTSREPDLVMIVTSISGRAWGRNKDSQPGATWFSIAERRRGSIL